MAAGVMGLTLKDRADGERWTLRTPSADKTSAVQGTGKHF
jgi:hypothetical protein